MRLKTYLAKNMDEALAQIRREMGSEAVIVSSLNEGKKIRVTAAIDQIPVTPEQSTEKASPKHIQNILIRIAEYHKMPDQVRDQFIERVSNLGSAQYTSGLEACLEKIFHFSPLSLSSHSKSAPTILLTGSMGVGKSITLAKMAAELVINGQSAQIITTDSQKAGAISQMQAYGDALSTPIHVISNPQDLETFCTNRDRNDVLLIDTPGINPFVEGDCNLLSTYIMALKQPPILVLPAGGDPTETLEQVEAYKTLGVTKLIMTKMDLVKRVGSLITALIGGNLELCAFSSGATLGSLLKPASTKLLGEYLTAHLPADSAPPTQETPKETMSKTDTLPQWLQGVREMRR